MSGVCDPVVTIPGAYSLSSEEYHASSALSSSGARKITAECPALFRYGKEKRGDSLDIGTATHLAVLQPDLFEKQVVVLDAGDRRKQATRDAETALRAAGRLVVLPREFSLIKRMRDAVHAHPVAGLAFRDGVPEQALFWRDREFDIVCRALPDWLPLHRRYIIDLKTAASANPAEFEQAIQRYGYHQQASWYLDGVEAVHGERPAQFIFVVVSKEPPHPVSVFPLMESSIFMGAVLNRRARGIFAYCQRENVWPEYQMDVTSPPMATPIGLPEWSLRRLQAQYEAGELEPPSEVTADE